MRWFTNSRFKSDIKDWMRYSKGSVVVVGPPQTTAKSAPMEQLLKWKMVGLYETKPGVPPLPAALE